MYLVNVIFHTYNLFSISFQQMSLHASYDGHQNFKESLHQMTRIWAYTAKINLWM